MFKTLTLICLILAASTLSSCKDEQERRAEALREEVANMRKATPGKNWHPPDFSKKKPVKEDGK